MVRGGGAEIAGRSDGDGGDGGDDGDGGAAAAAAHVSTASNCDRSVSVGTLWSTVSSVQSGRRTERRASRSPSKACGDVTSCTRWRSM